MADIRPLVTELEIITAVTATARNTLLKSRQFPENFLERYFVKFLPNEIIVNQTLSEEFILKRKIMFDWKLISIYQINNLSDTTIEKYAENLHWPSVIQYRRLPSSLLHNLITSYSASGPSENIVSIKGQTIDMLQVAQYQVLDMAFIERYCKELSFDAIAQYQKLSESFIDRHAECLNWNLICQHQKLSEAFMIKMRNYLDFAQIIKYQEFSNTFIMKFLDRIIRILIAKNNQ